MITLASCTTRDCSNLRSVSRVPTAALAAAGLILGFAVALTSGSRTLGGLPLMVCGVACIAIWLSRDGIKAALLLTAAGLIAFVLSHLLGLVIGAWPAVFVTAACVAALYWCVSDMKADRPLAG